MRHEGYAFATFLYVVATLMFCLVAWFLGTVIGGLVCAATALALGALIVGLMWPAQRRYYAEMRSREIPRAG